MRPKNSTIEIEIPILWIDWTTPLQKVFKALHVENDIELRKYILDRVLNVLNQKFEIASENKQVILKIKVLIHHQGSDYIV